MKRSDSGDFCLLYIEPEDDKNAVFTVIGEQKKPVVVMLSPQTRTRVFARPEDFSDLKHVKRQHNAVVIFVIAGNDYPRQLAARNGFPAYVSIDALSEALEQGQLAISRQRTLARAAPPAFPAGARKTVPLSSQDRGVSARKTVPLTPSPAAPTPAPSRAPASLLAQDTLPPARPASRASAAVVPPPAPPQVVMRSSRRQRGSRGSLVALVLISLLIVGGATLGYYLFYAHADSAANVPAVPPQILGSAHFLSSEQLSETSDQGLNDQVQVDLSGIRPPVPGMSYYAWLLSDASQGESNVVLLGKLTVQGNAAHLFYKGDAQHTNLLAITSRFLVTEESASVTPVAPSPDNTTWRFYGQIPQTPNPRDANHFSYLDHVRHLLSGDPLLNELELPGGLGDWFYRNTGKLIEWTTSARDRWEEAHDLPFARRQIIRALAYLDGLSYITQDIPAGTQMPYIPNLASVGLIDMNGVNQVPPSFLSHIERHLNGLLSSPGATDATRTLTAQLIEAMSNVRQWLNRLHNDAKQLVAMSDSQLGQASAFSLLNDMVDQASAAYTGQTDPVSGQMRPGAIWIHDHLQTLAVMEITRYVVNVQSPQIVPTGQPVTRVEGQSS